MGAYENALLEQRNPDVLRDEVYRQKAEADRLRAENARLTERYNWDHASCNAWRADAEKQIQRLQEENERLRSNFQTLTDLYKDRPDETTWLMFCHAFDELKAKYASTRDARRVERALRHKDTNGVYPSDDPSNPWVHMVGRTLGILLDEWERRNNQPDIDTE